MKIAVIPVKLSITHEELGDVSAFKQFVHCKIKDDFRRLNMLVQISVLARNAHPESIAVGLQPQSFSRASSHSIM